MVPHARARSGAPIASYRDEGGHARGEDTPLTSLWRMGGEAAAGHLLRGGPVAAATSPGILRAVMRVLLVNELPVRAGGAEEHLRSLIPGLEERGHEVGFLHGRPLDGAPPDRRVAPCGVTTWCAAIGPADTLEAVRAWRPDVVYAHRLIDSRVLAGLDLAGC